MNNPRAGTGLDWKAMNSAYHSVREVVDERLHYVYLEEGALRKLLLLENTMDHAGEHCEMKYGQSALKRHDGKRDPRVPAHPLVTASLNS